MGLYAASKNFTGFLRWAYDSWVEDPLYDTNHVTWAAGDCFLVYPNARSSIRFERLREGIVDFEKIRILREKVEKRGSVEAKKSLEDLEKVLSRFSYEAASKDSVTPLVNEAKKALEKVSRSTKR